MQVRTEAQPACGLELALGYTSQLNNWHRLAWCVDLFTLLGLSQELSYFGLGVISFVGSLIPFVPVPSFIFLVSMSAGDTFNLHALALISALTATAAKQIIFAISYGGRRILSPKKRSRIRPFERLVKKYGGVATFVAAATPIPDDLVYIPLGLARYNPLRFFVYTLSGKLLLNYATVLLAHYLGASLVESAMLQVDNNATYAILGIVVFGAIVTVVIIALLQLDWARILGRIAPWALDNDDDSGST